MVLFVAIAVAIVWISGCALGLALCAMLARAEGREPAARRARGRARDRDHGRYAAPDGLVPTA